MITIIGWVCVGIIIGFVMGVVLVSMLSSGQQADLEAENIHLRFVRDSLKDEIFRLDNQSKPKPRSKRRKKYKKINIYYIYRYMAGEPCEWTR